MENNMIKKEYQQEMLDLLCEDFGEVRRHHIGAFEDWVFVKDFDRHSPCRNLLITTPNGSEVKVFVPNSHVEDLNSEMYDTFMVWFDVFGMGDNEGCIEFNDIDDVVGYVLEQWYSDNV